MGKPMMPTTVSEGYKNIAVDHDAMRHLEAPEHYNCRSAYVEIDTEDENHIEPEQPKISWVPAIIWLVFMSGIIFIVFNSVVK